MTVLAWAAPFIILAGIGSYALSVRDGRDQPWLLVRARFAWRCRGKPVPADGEKLTREEIQVLGNLDAGRDVRART